MTETPPPLPVRPPPPTFQSHPSTYAPPRHRIHHVPTRNKRGTLDWVWKGGAICAGVVIMGLVLLGAGTGSEDTTARETSGSRSLPALQASVPPVERVLESRWSNILFAAKQEIFDAFHPLGTATRIELHAVDVKWKNDIRTNRLEDIQGMGLRYSVFWEGPVTKDGFTKLYSIYDAELGRLVGSEILSTNGVTNSEMAEGIGLAIGLGLSSALENE